MSTPHLARQLRERPVVITGLGAFSAAGQNATALWDAALAGRAGAVFEDFVRGAETARFPVCRAAGVDAAHPDFRYVRKLDRSAQIAWPAAQEAWAQANLAGAYPAERVGLMLGSSRGPLGKRNEQWAVAGQGRPAPSLVVDSTFGSMGGAVAQILHLQGPGACVSATCASSAFAIAYAAQQILLGEADAMLAGGAEAPIYHVILEQLKSAGVLGSHEIAAHACRPFDEDRNGLVLGEGSAFLVLENEEAARARGAKPLARLAGWGLALEGLGRAKIDKAGGGMRRVMSRALEVAGLNPADIGYINAHGTGTQLNDSAEANAILKMFAETSALCGSTKPVTGHCLGSTSAMEAIICVEALRNQVVPPTVCQPGAKLVLPERIQPRAAQPKEFSAAISNALGFWGYHASLVFATA